MKNFIKLGVIALTPVVSLLITSCSTMIRPMVVPQSAMEIPLTPSSQRSYISFNDLDKSLRVIVTSSSSDEVVKFDLGNEKTNTSLRRAFPVVTFSPGIKEFATSAAIDYIQQMKINISTSADYTLYIDVKEFDCAFTTLEMVKGNCQLTYRLTDESGTNVLSTTLVSSTKSFEQKSLVKTSKGKMQQELDKLGVDMGNLYARALGEIDWNRIADFLKVAKTAKQEKNAQVKGNGDTALEHTVIRWSILSSPQGADVSWRVVSSTPDVANTNANYIGTTPYESTESFDVRGLTYNNSGNVQIEVTCERPGYLPQKKRFNLRQAIDQKEISAKFNLIKDE